MIGTTPINNHPNKTWKASVKIQETHLSSKRNKPLQKFSARRPLGEDGDLERKENREARRILQKLP